MSRVMMKCGGCDRPMGVDAKTPGREMYIGGFRWCAECGSLTADRPNPDGETRETHRPRIKLSREYFNVYAVVERADYFGVFRNPLVGVAELKAQGEIVVLLNALPLSGKLTLVPREENEFERTTREMMEGRDK